MDQMAADKLVLDLTLVLPDIPDERDACVERLISLLKHEDIDQDDVMEIADSADTPEASLDRSRTSAILRACVAKLSPAHREIINLVYYHEKSVEEAGAIIGIPQSTVKTRMFYARKQLAELLKGAGVDSLAA